MYKVPSHFQIKTHNFKFLDALAAGILKAKK